MPQPVVRKFAARSAIRSRTSAIGFGNVSRHGHQPEPKAARRCKIEQRAQPEALDPPFARSAASGPFTLQPSHSNSTEDYPLMKLVLQKTFRIALFAPLLFSGWAVASAQQTTDSQADNTKMNQRDRNSNEA